MDFTTPTRRPMERAALKNITTNTVVMMTSSASHHHNACMSSSSSSSTLYANHSSYKTPSRYSCPSDGTMGRGGGGLGIGGGGGAENDNPCDTTLGGLSLEGATCRSALTDAPVRNTQNRSVHMMRGLANTDCKLTSITRMVVDNDSPAVEQMMQRLLIEQNSPFSSAVESAERQLDLTVSPSKPGQKRGRESCDTDDFDLAQCPLLSPVQHGRAKEAPFRDQPYPLTSFFSSPSAAPSSTFNAPTVWNTYSGPPVTGLQ